MSGQRGPMSSAARLRDQLSDRDLAIVRLVHEFRFLTGRQLQALLFDGERDSSASSARRSRRVLNRLTELGLLQRLNRRIGGIRAGSASFIYCLSFQGHRVLESGRERQGHRVPSFTFLDHSLAIADIFVKVVTASKVGELELVRYQTEPGTWRSLPGYGKSDTLRPDLHLILSRADLEYHWWVEVDLGTEYQRALEQKCKRYLAYWQSGQHQDEGDVFPRVAWLTTSPARASYVRALAERIQGSVPLFEVGLLDRPFDVLVPAEGAP